MSVGIYNVLTWLLVGLAGGSIAALALTARTRGFGLLRNLILGVTGALVGGAAFAMFNLFPNLDRIAISARDLLAAVLGSLVVYFLHWVWQKRRCAQPLAAAQELPPPR
ncbi:MAG: GlsB/YeaQ/YmgE family stress response membrane protein [Beijerinckiaceae bacterium]|nr:GlsB/YeaQ/YmgE family stress response membrane protein [Beijerinckiaceae bacterium]